MANQRSKDVIIGAFAGAVLGAVTALLLAPKSGRELRADIADGYQQVSGKTQRIAKQVGSQTSQWIGKAKEITTQAVRQVRAWKSGAEEDEAAPAAKAEKTEVAEESVSLAASAAEEEEQEEEELALVR
jgi:gas vesicle protein